MAAYKVSETRSEAVLLEKKLKNFKSGAKALHWLINNGGAKGRPDS